MSVQRRAAWHGPDDAVVPAVAVVTTPPSIAADAPIRSVPDIDADITTASESPNHCIYSTYESMTFCFLGRRSPYSTPDRGQPNG